MFLVITCKGGVFLGCSGFVITFVFMENNLQFEVFDMKDFMTEDEISNFWIDLYVDERDYKKQLEENKGKTISAIAAAGKTVTLTITKNNFR